MSSLPTQLAPPPLPRPSQHRRHTCRPAPSSQAADSSAPPPVAGPATLAASSSVATLGRTDISSLPTQADQPRNGGATADPVLQGAEGTTSILPTAVTESVQRLPTATSAGAAPVDLDIQVIPPTPVGSQEAETGNSAGLLAIQSDEADVRYTRRGKAIPPGIHHTRARSAAPPSAGGSSAGSLSAHGRSTAPPSACSMARGSSKSTSPQPAKRKAGSEDAVESGKAKKRKH
ncbi:hypothetical protein LshimejAT787_0112140 [Lyophyllum shimeji]|uniref:Uncharacterized protein n=1 Tax=Lyophyllum shimeji TaxID=47721 RepID=A0A9P3UKC3_LYOSH|nr:hypothetical protein LshimejAT787_0112140 [Lyophyllum shimeji]